MKSRSFFKLFLTCWCSLKEKKSNIIHPDSKPKYGFLKSYTQLFALFYIQLAITYSFVFIFISCSALFQASYHLIHISLTTYSSSLLHVVGRIQKMLLQDFCPLVIQSNAELREIADGFKTIWQLTLR